MVTVSLLDSVYSVDESSGVVQVCVELEGEMEDLTAVVQLSTQPGTALAPSEGLNALY